MRIYPDNCCFNRPHDVQSSFRVSLEAQAKLYMQEKARQGLYDLVCSYMLEYENSKNKDVMKRNSIESHQVKFCKYYDKDAVHVACAVYAECDYFLTTDIRLQKRYKDIVVKTVNPPEFISITEGERM
ncbi:MAG: hypothetical protein II877_07070 [Synergistaceae bacterium]|nr:hypothetical protein [Synergistaceae bacterium]